MRRGMPSRRDLRGREVREKRGGWWRGGGARGAPDAPPHFSQKQPSSGRLLLPLCALCMYLLYLQLAPGAAPPVPAGVGLTVRVSRSGQPHRKAGAGVPDAGTRAALAASDKAAASLAARLAASGAVGVRATTSGAAAGAAVQAAATATAIARAQALEQARPTADAAAAAASALRATPAPPATRPPPTTPAPTDARPALATDPGSQPLAEPAGAGAAAAADLFRSVLSDAVDPVPPAGAGAVGDDARRLAVRAAMAHSWAGYKKHAYGQDEVAPKAGRGYETFCSLGATLIDSLDTLWLMGFKHEFALAREWVAAKLDFTRDCGLSVFESTIRVMGGLLAAFDMTGDRMFVDKAEDLALALGPAYETPLNFPRSEMHLSTRTARTPAWIGGGQAALLAEVGTVQMELLSLAAATGNVSYARTAETIVRNLNARHPGEGLLPIYVSLADAAAAGPVTVGAMADSYYEYLLKTWLLKRKTRADGFRDMWVKSMDDIVATLVRESDVGGHMYVGELAGGAFVQRMEHLTCFLGGNLALGVAEGAVSGEKAARYLEVAKGITETCYMMYKLMPTGEGGGREGGGRRDGRVRGRPRPPTTPPHPSPGLAPEFVRFPDGAPMAAAAEAPHNLLRPEAVEAIFMLHRVTGDPKYREWGWEIFQAFDKHCKVGVEEGGRAGWWGARRAADADPRPLLSPDPWRRLLGAGRRAPGAARARRQAAIVLARGDAQGRGGRGEGGGGGRRAPRTHHPRPPSLARPSSTFTCSSPPRTPCPSSARTRGCSTPRRTRSSDCR